MVSKNKILGLILFSLMFVTTQAQNFIDSSVWNPSNPATQQGNFTAISGNDYNAVVSGTNPFGNTVPLWETSQGSDYAGFDYTHIDLDPAKTYRFAIWFKITEANSGVLAFRLWGQQSNSLLDPSQNGTNSVYYPLAGYSLPAVDQWFLVVNFVKGTGDTNSYTGGVFTPDGNPISGAPTSTNGFSFHNTFTTLHFRTMFWNSTNPATKLLMYAPSVVEVAPADNSFDDLFESGNEPGLGESLWTANGDDIHYSDGSVGIGTDDPGSYKLAVNGNIRAKEVKVETGWADYVFEKEYDLPTLQEVEQHIREKGHLINIPSASEVEANGIELGEINRLLLEKIEELTLYIIGQEKRIKLLENKNL